jgi:uncharacterized protein (TIGR03437 family)
LVNGTPIPVLYVSDSQINAEVLAPLNSMNNAVVRIVNGSATLPDFRVSVDDSIVGVFQNADGSAKAVNQDGTINSSSNPAKVGSIVSIWATGLAGNSGIPINGQLSTVANNWCSFCQITVGSVNLRRHGPGPDRWGDAGQFRGSSGIGRGSDPAYIGFRGR